jgi:exodeoxyribonuclease VII large subunit
MEPRFKEALTVSELTREIRTQLEDNFDAVRVEGEVSGSKRHTSGHFYFTLKDEGAVISAVMWKSAALRTTLPSDGDRVVAAGRISLFEPRGAYQLMVTSFKPVGEGDLRRRFDELRQRLEAEGLFDPSAKRGFPPFPSRIAVITSQTGAVLQDIRNVLSRRSPHVELLVIPSPVQGADAVPGILQAFARLEYLAGTPFEPDAVVIARGGGSIEDLWAFNEEPVVRAVAACPWPVLSAIGHETDFTLCDFAADLRAPTPSAAAEMVAPHREALLEELDSYLERMREALSATVARRRERLELLASRPCLKRPEQMLQRPGQRLDWLQDRLSASGRRTIERAQARLARSAGQLDALSPLKVIARGFAAVEAVDGHILSSVEGLVEGAEIRVRFSDGRVRSRILDVEKGAA